MCLYPTLMKNKKYTKTKKNGGVIPPLIDSRCAVVAIGCQECIECRNQKKAQWQIRMKEECRVNKNGKFITLTFNTKSLEKIYWAIEDDIVDGKDIDNLMATWAIRHFLERWRKKYKKSVRHWFVTELGHEGTEHLHIHGIMWTDVSYEEIEKIWKYGFIWPTKDKHKKTYVNERTVNYLIKYISKIDEKNPTYKSKVYCSAGIGRNYVNTPNAKLKVYNGERTDETYNNRNGSKQALPIYYRNKIYSEKEREQLWIHKLDKGERYVMGMKIHKNMKETDFINILKAAQRKNIELGFGTGQKDWEEIEYRRKLRNIKIKKRISGKERILEENLET